MAALIDYLDDLEIGLWRSINRLGHNTTLRYSFACVSKLGDWYFWVAMGALLFAYRGVSVIPEIVVMLAVFGIGLAVYRCLKTRFVRERPFVNDHGILCGAAPLDRYSFPSGHTLHAVSFSIMLPQVEPLLAPVVVPFAALVAMSRIVLGLHYPTDVAVGGAIGAALAVAALPFL